MYVCMYACASRMRPGAIESVLRVFVCWYTCMRVHVGACVSIFGMQMCVCIHTYTALVCIYACMCMNFRENTSMYPFLHHAYMCVCACMYVHTSTACMYESLESIHTFIYMNM
jgi:hypothetical protein